MTSDSRVPDMVISTWTSPYLVGTSAPVYWRVATVVVVAGGADVVVGAGAVVVATGAGRPVTVALEAGGVLVVVTAVGAGEGTVAPGAAGREPTPPFADAGGAERAVGLGST